MSDQAPGPESGARERRPDTAPGEAREAPRLRYLDPEQVEVRQGEDGALRATVAGEFTVLSPRFVRVCPLTDPDRYLSLRGQDPGGKEFGLLRHWRRLDAESRRLVEQELARRYLQPVVKRILSLREYGGLQLCVVETDRGVREITLRDVRDNVIYLNGTRVLITDAEGNRYDVPDIGALDRASRAHLARIL